nr:uncharacterized protein LOC125421493 [Ziziphus jujuba var. spinosa]XP_048336063.1 uncharacterized protein LOC125424001 [Ziziphus jujuba var. spinosa]
MPPKRSRYVPGRETLVPRRSPRTTPAQRETLVPRRSPRTTPAERETLVPRRTPSQRENLAPRRSPRTTASSRRTASPMETPSPRGRQPMQTPDRSTTPTPSETSIPSGPEYVETPIPNITSSRGHSPIDPVDESTEDTPVSTGLMKKNTRGITRGLEILKTMASNTKLRVQVSDGDMHAYGDHCSPFANQIGIAVRNFVSPRLKGWKYASDDERKIVYKHIADRFDIDLNDPQWIEIVERHCRDRYKNNRSYCNNHFKLCKMQGKDPLQFRPKRLRCQEDWEWLCAHFESPEFLVS